MIKRRSDLSEPCKRNGAATRVPCDLWMFGHESSTILRCRCDNSGEAGLHLLAPRGYGIAEGQRYELRPYPPGARPISGFGPPTSRWARIVRTEIRLDGGHDRLGVGVSRPRRAAACSWLSMQKDGLRSAAEPRR